MLHLPFIPADADWDRDRTHMIYNQLGQNDIPLIIVILESPAQVATAIKELNDAPIFYGRVEIVVLKRVPTSLHSFRWGWYATESSSLEGVTLRYPHTSPPKNLFSSYKTGRQVYFRGFPYYNELQVECTKWLYARLHQYNVRGLSRVIDYTPRGSLQITRCLVAVEFETKETAEEVQSLYKNQKFNGFPIAVSTTKPPMKHLSASWDTGHNRAHDQLRDDGTAEGTNFESAGPLAVIFGRLSCTTIVTWPSLLTFIRCRMKCIEDGFLGNRTGVSGCQYISIKSSACHVIDVRD
jgi:hypothetical protein